MKEQRDSEAERRLLETILDPEADESFLPANIRRAYEEEDEPGYGWCSCGCPLDEEGRCVGAPPCSVNENGYMTPGGR